VEKKAYLDRFSVANGSFMPNYTDIKIETNKATVHFKWQKHSTPALLNTQNVHPTTD